ncbi:MAG: TIGR02147 family protein [Chitinispirillaceae bacterium]|nr:TIGR02147 family protein [Chitinispirillaceae bacterium]
MVTIFDYLDYREFLRDYYKEAKRNKPFFSYRFIGNRVGMDSSYVIKVLQGNLHISAKKINDFIKLLELGEPEAEYFETLVHFCRAKTERQRKLCFDRLFSLSSVKAQRLEPHQYEFFQKWYYSAVWAIINCTPFNGDFHALADACMPAITVWDAKRAVRLLTRLGLIVKEADGTYRTTGQNLTTGWKWYSHAIESNQREMIRLAGEAINRFAKETRDISTVTMGIDEKALPEIREHIRQFRSSLIKTVNSHAGTGRVYQLNIQLFPLSADLEKKP